MVHVVRLVAKLFRVEVVADIQPFVRRRVDVEVNDAVLNADKVAVVVPVAAEADATRVFLVGAVDNFADFAPVGDAAAFALETLMNERRAGERRRRERFGEPSELFRRDNRDRGTLVFKVVAVRVVRKGSVVAEIVAVQNDEAEAVAVEGIVAFVELVRGERFRVGTTVEVVVAAGMVARNFEVLVTFDELALFFRVVAEVAAVDDERAFFANGALLDFLQAARSLRVKRTRAVVQVGEKAEFNGRVRRRFRRGFGLRRLRSAERRGESGSGADRQKTTAV